jgi:hypothetical protein
MRTRLAVYLLAAALVPSFAQAKDILPPHDKAQTNTACYYCHNLQVVTASGSHDYNPGCLDCHNQDGRIFGMPWAPTDQAVPGISGSSHSWTGAANSPAYGANANLIPNQALLVDGGLQCVICHDLHDPQAALDPNSMHTSIPVGVPQAAPGAMGAGPGTASLTLTAPAGTPAEGFRLKIQTVDATGGTFIISHTYGTNVPTWLVWSGTAWVAGPIDGVGARFNYGTDASVDVALDVAGAKVRWEKGATGAVPGDFWDFYIGYPFLRLSNVDDNGCYSCHTERKMNHTRARGLDNTYLPNGVRKFSHPVGVALNVNGFNTDRTTVLDVDGTPGSSATDGLDAAMQPVRNDSNDLVFGTGATVKCTTCHSVHNTDSNSLTVDVR